MLVEFHTCPVRLSDGVETSNLLATGIIFDELDIARNVDLALFFGHFALLIGDRQRTKSTAVANHIFDISEKRRMAMKINLAVLVIPLRIQKKVLRVQKLLNLSRVESPAIWHCLPIH